MTPVNPGVIGLEIFPPLSRFSSRISLTRYLEISKCLFQHPPSEFENLPVLYFSSLATTNSQGKLKSFHTPPPTTSVSTPLLIPFFICSFFSSFLLPGILRNGGRWEFFGDTIPVCRVQEHSWLPAGWMHSLEKETSFARTRQKSEQSGDILSEQHPHTFDIEARTEWRPVPLQVPIRPFDHPRPAKKPIGS